jgi:NADP-dependent 3-hydroxy acid dehydrogenase YdfG
MSAFAVGNRSRSRLRAASFRACTRSEGEDCGRRQGARPRHGTPDYLVNNAGRGVYGDFACETDLEAELSMVHLNVVAVVELTKRFAREMVARGSGRILITSSIAALAPRPKLNVYSATKAFAFAFPGARQRASGHRRDRHGAPAGRD